MNTDKSPLRERIHNFFENPDSAFAYSVQGFIAILILASVGIFAVEFWYSELFLRYQSLFNLGNNIILAVFTVEYILRFSTASRKLHFATRPFSVIDFVAIFPNYLELLLPLVIDTTELRVLRLLRFARLLRVLKFLRYGSIFRKVFLYQGTILQKITPIILLFASAKGIIWVLESYNLWIPDSQLGTLFTIIGFVLGIILSQKIGVSYGKFIEVGEAVVRIRARLGSLETMLNNAEKGLGTGACTEWGRSFYLLLTHPQEQDDTRRMGEANAKLHEAVLMVEKNVSWITIFIIDIIQDARFCLSKKTRLVPKPYDTLLHQSTMLYLALVVIFIPGMAGMLSALVATYTLYGMYYLTQDFDSIFGGEFDLININVSELEEYLKIPAAKKTR
ncbi:hypothetical protein A3C86_00340 [Candidatus Kaiserbacteria bacterium RIFCSPHIGHO2_02_FULL_49_16]|uniref:Ion transport domain-containing protein n=1 Tax=Candidatus Kaiserbacteria bacterium RIFCSPHIGHO2_02_FULL_49_16 TaxID=1798490 RepID=A0A1F6DHS2_9BACT|nr:MAG: hypothetical protein A3C86_00340 [Candidatus Kaiserbacteria bacterium RIFCSPHIGHO2_02_FULL_49_16]